MERSPISQKIILWSLESCVMETRNMIIAPQNAFTITPERSSVFFLRIDCPDDIIRSKTSVAILPRKAVKLTPGKRDNPANMPIMAPIAEPPEMPRIYGSASGFRRRAWKTRPPRERVAPTRAARSTRGKRICQTIVFSMESAPPSPNSDCNTAFTPFPVDPMEIPISMVMKRRSKNREETHAIRFRTNGVLRFTVLPQIVLGRKLRTPEITVSKIFSPADSRGFFTNLHIGK
jgi:hypothetical protein